MTTMTKDELDTLIDQVEELPPAPDVLPKLLQLLGEPDVDADAVGELINHDASLTTGVLALANGAHYGGGMQATMITEAIMRLGFQEIFKLVAAVSGKRAFASGAKSYIDESQLWLHSVATGVACQVVAERTGETPNEAFTVGLLHDIGKNILAQALGEDYGDAVTGAEEKQSALYTFEKERFGAHHAELGGRVLARWKFPPQIIACVWFHHTPTMAKPYEGLASVVWLGNYLAHAMGYGFGGTPVGVKDRDQIMDLLDISYEEIPGLLHSSTERLNDVVKLFKSGV